MVYFANVCQHYFVTAIEECRTCEMARAIPHCSQRFPLPQKSGKSDEEKEGIIIPDRVWTAAPLCVQSIPFAHSCNIASFMNIVNSATASDEKRRRKEWQCSAGRFFFCCAASWCWVSSVQPVDWNDWLATAMLTDESPIGNEIRICHRFSFHRHTHTHTHVASHACSIK